MTSHVEVRRSGHVLEVTLNKPKVNAIDHAMSRELGAAFALLRDDPELRVAILTAAGDRIFSAGWDLKALDAGETKLDAWWEDGDYGDGGFAGLTENWRLNKPVIAALNGLVIGGGFELALACDLLIAADHVEFALPEMPLGIVPDAGAIQRLPRRIPYNIAMEMFLLGRRMPAAEAAQYGLVNRVVPKDHLMDAARDWAGQLAKAAPLALQSVKEVLRRIEMEPLQNAFGVMRTGELPTYRAMLRSEDAAEGVRAFVEKREPVFKGALSMIAPDSVRRVASLGAGPIGAGWAAHFLARGYDVTAWIYDPAEEAALRSVIDTAWISLEGLGLAPGASRDRLVVTADLEQAVGDAEFVQESSPEILEVKQALYERLGRIVPAETVIASSTSGLTMTEIQARCPTPGRTVVGHPFNPPYLLPLVEIVGGARTDPATVAWARDFYAAAGKAPLVMRKEVPGFVATRLQEALWREALHMVANGEATPEDIDTALIAGPGPRLALMGQCMAFHVACGPGGMATNLDQFGPALKLPWTRLEAPELTQELRDRMVEGCNRMAAGRHFTDLAAERDRGIVAILRAVRENAAPAAPPAR